MTSNEQQLEEVELSIEQARTSVDNMHSLKKLRDSEHFKAVIEENYFKNEASRLVILRADHTMQDETSQKVINDQITAIGYLRLYFSTIFQLGHMAENAIKGDEATREELLQEGVG